MTQLILCLCLILAAYVAVFMVTGLVQGLCWVIDKIIKPK